MSPSFVICVHSQILAVLAAAQFDVPPLPRDYPGLVNLRAEPMRKQNRTRDTSPFRR